MIGIIYPFFILVTIVTCVLVVTCRINCNRCGADHKAIKNLERTRRTAHFFFFFAVIVFVAACFVVAFYSTYS